MDNDFSNIGNSVSELTSSSQTMIKRDWVKIALVFAVLALLGINIFTYLSQITDWFRKVFGPIFADTVGGAAKVVGESAKQTVKTAAAGTTSVVSEVAKGTESGISELQDVLDGKAGRVKNNIDGRGIDTNSLRQTQSQFVINQEQEDASTDFLGQKTKGHGNAGYCYIGEDRGVRTCAYVGNGDMCMSGMIYPTMDVCVNPNLRA